MGNQPVIDALRLVESGLSIIDRTEIGALILDADRSPGVRFFNQLFYRCSVVLQSGKDFSRKLLHITNAFVLIQPVESRKRKRKAGNLRIIPVRSLHDRKKTGFKNIRHMDFDVEPFHSPAKEIVIPLFQPLIQLA